MVTRNDVIAARLAHRKATCTDGAIKAEIALGEKWQGADNQSGHAMLRTRHELNAIEANYREEFGPRKKSAEDNLRAAGKQLAVAAEGESNCLLQIGVTEIEIADRESYFKALTEERKTKSPDERYEVLLASHSESESQKIKALKEKVASLRSDLASIRSKRVRLADSLVTAGESLAALAL